MECFTTSSQRTVRCWSCFRRMAVLILSPRSCDEHLWQPLVGLLKLVMDGFEFLALLDTCVHGLLHSLNAFTLRVQRMTHLIDEQLIPFARAPLATPVSPHEASPLLEVSVRHLQACVLCSSLTSKEAALLWQDRQSSQSSLRRSCNSRRSTAACSYSPVRKASDFDKCFVEVADPRLHPVPQTFSPV